MTNSRLKGRGAVAAMTAAVLLCAATAQASNVDLSLEQRGAATDHAALPVSTPEADAPDAQFWPIAAAIAVALLTMDRDYAPTEGQYDDVVFD